MVAVMESDEYPTADKMARAVIKAVADQLEMRTTWALTHAWDDGSAGINWGPFASVAESQKYAEKIGVNGKFHAVKLNSPGVILANAGAKTGIKGYCKECDHAGWSHFMDGSSRGRCAQCECARFDKR